MLWKRAVSRLVPKLISPDRSPRLRPGPFLPDPHDPYLAERIHRKQAVDLAFVVASAPPRPRGERVAEAGRGGVQGRDSGWPNARVTSLSGQLLSADATRNGTTPRRDPLLSTTRLPLLTCCALCYSRVRFANQIPRVNQ